MTKLNWGTPGERFYEAGVDRGVFYPKYGPGVAWNGLVSVSESPNGGEARPYYYDGEKYANVSSAEEFEATLEAFSSPPEFSAADGTTTLHAGLFATQQARQSFGLAYRTRMGNDTNGLEHGYKIHLVYGALAGPSERSNQTLTDSSEAMTLSWPITAMPVRTPGIKPTAHLVIDSTKSDRDMLAVLEGYLYGSVGIEPRLPSQSEVIALFRNWSFLGLDGPMNFLGVGSATKGSVVNQFTNPSFENIAGTTEVYRNLATNPSFESSNGTFEVYRNLATNPALAVDTVGYAYSGGTGGAATLARVPGITSLIGGVVTNSARLTWTTSPTGGARRITLPAITGVTEGQVITFSYWGRRLAAGVLYANVDWYNGGTYVQNVAVKAGSNVPAMTWVEFRGTLTVPAGVTIARPFLTDTGATMNPPGDWIEVSALLYGPNVPYFSGDYSPDSDLTPSWTGTANASPSILTANRVTTSTNSGSYYALLAQSSQWNASGTGKSARISSTRSQPGEAMAFLQGNFGNMAGIVPGKTYTVLAKVRMTGPITDDPSGRRIRLRTNGGTGAQSPQWPNEAGVYDVRFTGSILAGATDTMIQLNHYGVAGDPPIWIDDLAIVEGDYRGPYFDGERYADRRNLVQNPRGTSPSGLSVGFALNPQWYGSGGNGITTYVTGATDGPETTPGVTISSYGRKTWTVLGTAAAIISWQFSASGRVPMVVGTTFTASLYWRKSFSGGVSDNKINVEFWDAASGGTRVGPVGTGTMFTEPAAGEWQRVYGTFTVPVGATHVSVYHRVDTHINNMSVGTTVDATAALLEESTTLGDYFDGTAVPSPGFSAYWEGVANSSKSYINDVDLTSSWTGTAHESASILRGDYAASTIPATLHGRAISSKHWSASGTKSVRVIPISSNVDTHVSVGGDTGGLRAGMEPGKLYTILATMRLTAPQTGGLNSYARRITSWSKVGAAAYVNTISDQAPNVAGVHQLRHTFTVPVGATEAFIRLYNGASVGNGDVWFENVLLVEGDYDGPYFDGSFSSVIQRGQESYAAWTGTAHASTSKIDYYLDLPETASSGDAWLIEEALWVYQGFWRNYGLIPTIT